MYSKISMVDLIRVQPTVYWILLTLLQKMDIKNRCQNSQGHVIFHGYTGSSSITDSIGFSQPMRITFGKCLISNNN